MYHGIASCQGCHPAYTDLDGVNEARKAFEQGPSKELRANAFASEPKESTTFTRARPGAAACDDDTPCEGKQICNFNLCEDPLWITPPDFLFNEVRAGSTPEELFRVIAAGVPGTAMPTWKGAIKDPEIWAIAYYVSDLIRIRGSDEAVQLRKSLLETE